MNLYNQSIQFNFETRPVNVVEIDGIKRMNAVEICQVLGYAKPKSYWTNLKKRNPELAQKTVRVAVLVTTNGEFYNTETLAFDGVVRLCMLAKSEKAIKFRDWAEDILIKGVANGSI